MKILHVPEPRPVARSEVTLDGAEAARAWSVRLAGELQAGDVLILTGELGAGQNTFTRGLGAGLGVRTSVVVAYGPRWAELEPWQAGVIIA